MMVLLFIASVGELVVEVASDLAQLALAHVIVAALVLCAVTARATVACAEVLRLRELLFIMRFQKQVCCRLIFVLSFP